MPDITTTGGTRHAELDAWVEEVAAHTRPDQIVWVDGSPEERSRIEEILVAAGTASPLAEDQIPHSYLALSDTDDVARVEDRTFICSVREEDSGHTNNWMAPQEMKAELWPRFEGSMRGRTMYVIPFVMGHLEAEEPKFGVELTDSPYVVASMRIMARVGSSVLSRMEELEAPYVKGLHSLGAPLQPGEQDVPWPCNEDKYIVHFPEERTIWSYGSGYGGNALLGKKCYALRIASPRRGLDGRAHAHPQAHRARRRRALRRGRVPLGLRQDQPGHDPPDDPGVEGRAHR